MRASRGYQLAAGSFRRSIRARIALSRPSSWDSARTASSSRATSSGSPSRRGNYAAGMRGALVASAGLAFVGRVVYRLVARGQLTLDTGIGRRNRPLGPVHFEIAAPRGAVFDVIATPYLDRTPRALQSELAVWERGSDMVLAAHFTQLKCGTTAT